MSDILEIRDACDNSLELLQSKAFNQYLRIYKKQYIIDLESRKNTEQKEEVIHKKEFVNKIEPEDFIEILNSKDIDDSKKTSFKEYIGFIEGLFHHYRGKSYTRLIKLHNDILSSDETSESIKDRISNRAHKLNILILDTRRKLLSKVDYGIGVRRSQGLECQPNVTCGEISGNTIKLPEFYSILNEVPITTHADMRTGIHYTTHANKRAFPFFH